MVADGIQRSSALHIGYTGLTSALVLASETFLLPRASSSMPALLMFVGSQIALCCILWAAVRVRPRLFERVSPVWVCIMFLLGVAWVIAGPEVFDADAPAVLTVLPAAVLFSFGNSLNAYLFFGYCRLIPADEFFPVAFGGSAVGSFVSYGISYLIPDYACILFGVIVFGWYALRREASRSTAGRVPLAAPPGRDADSPRPVAALFGSVVALCMAAGFMPAVVFAAQDWWAELGARLLLAGAILVLAAVAAGPVFALRAPLRNGMQRLADCAAVAAATGFVLFLLPGIAAVVCSTAVVLTALLACALALFHLYAQYVGDPGEHPTRFWSIQIVMLLVTAACTYGGMCLVGIDASGMLSLCLVCVWCLLLFAVSFHYAWRMPGTAGEASVASVSADVEEDIGRRCADIARTGNLTKREAEVLGLIASGWTIDMIARRLVVAPDTVRTHLKHLYPKVGVHSRSELLELIGVDGRGPLGRAGEE